MVNYYETKKATMSKRQALQQAVVGKVGQPYVNQ